MLSALSKYSAERVSTYHQQHLLEASHQQTSQHYEIRLSLARENLFLNWVCRSVAAHNILLGCRDDVRGWAHIDPNTVEDRTLLGTGRLACSAELESTDIAPRVGAGTCSCPRSTLAAGTIVKLVVSVPVVEESGSCHQCTGLRELRPAAHSPVAGEEGSTLADLVEADTDRCNGSS
jgi:hypothetical protein